MVCAKCNSLGAGCNAFRKCLEEENDRQLSSPCTVDADEGIQSNFALSAAQRSSGIASTSQPSQHHPAQHAMGPTPKHFMGANPKQLPHTQELEELFAVLSSWLSLGENRHGLASFDL